MMLLIIIASLFFANNSFDKKIQNYLNSHLSGYAKYEFEILGAPDPNSNIEIQYDRPFNINKNMVYVPVTISGSNQNSVSSVLSVKVRLYKNALIAKQNIKPKTDLNASMFETRLIEISSIRGTVLENSVDLSNKRSTSFMNKGTALTEEDIEKVPVLYSGDEVTALKTIGSVMITTQAYAREDGCVGDKIKIRTIDNKQFIAKVIDRKEVIIEE